MYDNAENMDSQPTDPEGFRIYNHDRNRVNVSPSPRKVSLAVQELELQQERHDRALKYVYIQLDKMKNELHECERKYNNKTEVAERLRRELNRMDHVDADNSELKDVIASMQQENTAAAATTKDLRNDIAHLRSLNTDLRHRLNQMEVNLANAYDDEYTQRDAQ